MSSLHPHYDDVIRKTEARMKKEGGGYDRRDEGKVQGYGGENTRSTQYKVDAHHFQMNEESECITLETHLL